MCTSCGGRKKSTFMKSWICYTQECTDSSLGLACHSRYLAGPAHPAGPSSDRASWQDGIRGRLLLNPTPSSRCLMTSYTFHSLHWTAITYVSDDPWLSDWFRSMWVSSEVCDETYIWRSPLYLTPLALWLVSNNCKFSAWLSEWIKMCIPMLPPVHIS